MRIGTKNRLWLWAVLLLMVFVAPHAAFSHPTSLAPASEGAGHIPHPDGAGPYMFNGCAQAYWESAKKTMQIFSAPIPVIYSDAYYDYLIYQGYVAALGGAKPPGGLGAAMGAILGGGGMLGIMPALPAACFPTG